MVTQTLIIGPISMFLTWFMWFLILMISVPLFMILLLKFGYDEDDAKRTCILPALLFSTILICGFWKLFFIIWPDVRILI